MPKNLAAEAVRQAQADAQAWLAGLDDRLAGSSGCYLFGPSPSLADLFADRVRTVRVHLQVREVPPGFAGGDYENDPVFRAAFQDWLNALWREKDARLAAWSRAPGA